MENGRSVTVRKLALPDRFRGRLFPGAIRARLQNFATPENNRCAKAGDLLIRKKVETHFRADPRGIAHRDCDDR
jgi:hypothetical protein